MSTETICFVSGASRGIGLALVAELVAKIDRVVVYAGVRNPETSSELMKIASSFQGKVKIVKYVAADTEGNKVIADIIQANHGHVDIVIANAGIASYMGAASETPAEEMRAHFETNAVGVLILFQAFFSLLKASNNPKFLPITSAAGSLTMCTSLPARYTAYGASKSALNYIARKIHYENSWITCFPLSPGIVKTDTSVANRQMDETGSLAPVQDQLQISPEKAASLLVNIVLEATREKDGGEYINIDSSKFPW